MRIKLTSVMVDDQTKALDFYTDKLGFVKKHDIPMGEHRWLTVVSPDDPNGTELLLEPMALSFAQTFQKELYGAGVPATAFFVEDIQAEYARMKEAGVAFRSEPTPIPGGPTIVQLEDTCGNLIQVVQV